jgi:hypothetical protein
MRAPLGERLLEVWERGARRHPLDRGLLLLSIARPDDALDALADVSIGERDRALLALRSALFGATLESVVDCPACGTRLELAIDAGELRTTPGPAEVDVHGIRVRPPSSRDLAAALLEPDDASAERCLAHRCLIAGSHGTAVLDADELSDVQLALAAADGASDIELDLACESCGHRWNEPFDIAGYLWSEIESRAQGLLRDVDALARAYGWSERDILALSDARRRSYLALVLP